MPRFADVLSGDYRSVQTTGAGHNYIVQTPAGVMYRVSIDADNDISFRKSTNNGLTWSIATNIFTGTATGLCVWYDRWSNIAAGLIHIAYTESTGSDTLYRTINTESSDALSTQTVIHAGTSQANGRFMAITRSRGGIVYCRTQIDAGAEGAFYHLVNANVPNGAWATRTINEANATLDQMALFPGFAADADDIIGVFYDNSATELSRQLFDASANTWAEASIDTDCTFPAANATFPHFSAAVDLTNSQIVLIMWNAVDTASQDLRCWTITESAITAKTDVVANATDDCGLAALSIYETQWWAFYCGKSDGSETWPTSVKAYFKVSTDSGATWGPETVRSSALKSLITIITCPRAVTEPSVLMGAAAASPDGNSEYAALVLQPNVQANIGI